MKKLWATLVFWFWVLLGPMVLGWLLQICWGMLGGDQEDLYRTVKDLVFFVQPWVCIMAYYSVIKITKEPGGYCTRYNCLVGVIVMAGLTVSDLLSGFFLRAASLGVSCVILVVCLNNVIQDYGNTAKDEPATPTPKPTPKPREKMEPWVIWCVIAMIAAAGLILGAGMLSQKQDRELEEAKEAAYLSGYSEGYNTGVADEKAKAKKEMSPNGLTVKRISEFVGQQYGLTPHEAANIISQYNHPGKDGAKPSWDEYMNAMWALAYTGTLIGY